MTIERRTDGGWYRDGKRIAFQRRGIFWDGCGSDPVLKLAREVVDHSQRIGWALVVFGANVTQQRSLGLDDEQRPARANPHPAAVENRSSRFYRVEFTTGDVAVIQITEQGHWVQKTPTWKQLSRSRRGLFRSRLRHRSTPIGSHRLS